MDPIKIVRDGAFYHHYQPIFELSTGSLWAYEALLRTYDGVPPEQLFCLVRQENLHYELDVGSIEKAIETFNSDKLLFLNIFPSTILHPDFHNFLFKLKTKIDLSRIVLELNESRSETEIWKSNKMEEELVYLRKNGIQIALDDISEGANGIKLIVRINPDIIKLDKYFASDFANQQKKIKMMTMLTEFCHPETKVILEGIETIEALEMAKSSKIDFGQGFFLGKPMMIEDKVERGDIFG